jgi:hypothetical protein
LEDYRVFVEGLAAAWDEKLSVDEMCGSWSVIC